MTIIRRELIDISDMDIFGHLVADLADGIGSIAMEAESDFFAIDTPIDLQVSVIGDWIQLLEQMKGFLEGTQEGVTIQ